MKLGTSNLVHLRNKKH